MGFEYSDIEIVIEDEHLDSIRMTLTMRDTVITLEYNFFDWDTTVIVGLD